MTAFETKNIYYDYDDGTKVLKGIDLSVDMGDRIAVIGENGSGKTTLSKNINRLLCPTKGRVFVNGEDTCGMTAAKVAWSVEYVFQNPNDQIFTSSVEAEVSAPLRRRKVKDDEIERRVSDALSLTGLSSCRSRHPYDLSLTKRKFVSIASAIAIDGDTLILDEPTAGLDPGEKKRLVSILDTLRKRGKTTITITHDMDFVAENFNKIIVMVRGTVRRVGRPEEIFYDEELVKAAKIEPPHIVQLMKKIPDAGNIVRMDDAVRYWRERI